VSTPLRIRPTIAQLIEGRNLDEDQASAVMREIMSGAASEAQIAAFLTALQVKGAHPQEITAFARVMREFSTPVHTRVSGRLVDTCGTGGDHQNTFNVSTTSALVLAGGGVAVAKHGNRSVSSSCGSADVLQALGVNIEAGPEIVARCIEHVGIGFLFAPRFHPAMRYALKPRRDIGIPTVFNVLGPLTNPANPNAQVLGVYRPELVDLMAEVLRDLGAVEALVVHGAGGLDEISPFGATKMAHLRNGQVERHEITPRDAGLTEERRVSKPPADVAQGVALLLGVLRDRADGFARNMTLLNAGAGFVVAGRVSDLRKGVELAGEVIRSGAALAKLRHLVEISGGAQDKLASHVA
jgi:anthranilate phosphoribosyltransferase